MLWKVTERCGTLWNVVEVLWGVVERYGTLWSIVLWNVTEALQIVTEHCRTLMERYGTDMKNINFAHH